MRVQKTTLLILVLITIWLPGWAKADSDDGSPLVQETIKLTNERLIYKGKSLKIPFKRKDLIRVFGEPSREIYNTAGNVVIWDELGLTCYGCQKQNLSPEEFEFMTSEEQQQQSKHAYIESISIFVRKHNPYPEYEKQYSHEPQFPFPGKLELDGADIDGVTTFFEFLELRKGRQTILLPENSFSFYIRCAPDPHEITLHTIRDKYSEDFMTIYSVSIRNIGHFYKNVTCSETFKPISAPMPVE